MNTDRSTCQPKLQMHCEEDWLKMPFPEHRAPFSTPSKTVVHVSAASGICGWHSELPTCTSHRMGISSLLVLLSVLPEKLQSLSWPPLYVLRMSIMYVSASELPASRILAATTYTLHTVVSHNLFLAA